MVRRRAASRTDGSSDYGQVVITPLGATELVSQVREVCFQLPHERYRWTPPTDLADQLPESFAIDFDVYHGPDGVRRFLPHGGAEGFIVHAFEAGLELLSRDRRLSPEQRCCYCTMKMVWGRVGQMREHLDREFNFSRDLFVRSGARVSDDDRSVLPCGLGGDQNADLGGWHPRRLCEEGRVRAREAGIEQATNDVAIHYGLLAAAERNPLLLDDSEVEDLVRSAMFARGDAENAPTQECVDTVYERFVRRLEEHRDDSYAEFDRWLAGAKSNLFKSIGGRSISTETVRGALLEIGWQAYVYVAGCVSYFVQALVRSLPVTLSPCERELIAQMYQPQGYLGGLSLVLMLERHTQLAPLIGRLWETPGDPDSIAILHRVLAYYAEMAQARREADRRAKASRSRRTIADSSLAEDSARTMKRESAGRSTERLMHDVVRRYRLRCDHCGRPHQCVTTTRLTHGANPCAVLEHWCDHHPGAVQELRIPLTELREIATDLAIEEPD